MYRVDCWARHGEYQQALLDICYEIKQQNEQSDVAPRAKNLYESDFDFFRRPQEPIKQLLEHCRSSVFEAAKHANTGRWDPGARIGVDVHESWCHITPRGGYHDAHTHPNSAWSGIYYIRAGESDIQTKNGVNRFYNPNQVAYSDISTRYQSELGSIDIPAEDGTMIIFPSWILHSAMTYQGNIDRVIVAFNCRFIQG